MASTLWIPAFAGMTGAKTNLETYPRKPMKGEGIRRLLFVLDFGRLAWFANFWIPAFAGMTGAKMNFETYPCKPIKGEGIYRSRFIPDFG